jgi:hypothetical protein
VSRRQGDRWSQEAEAQAYEQQQAAQAPPPDPAPASESDTLSQLKELGELKAAGILTEAEFETQKAKILAG